MAEEDRPRRNMMALLDFCTNMTVIEDAPASSIPNPSLMDPERQKFLADVMRSDENSAEQMRSKLQLLADSGDILETMGTVDAEEEALEDLMEIVQDMDHANDLFKIKGFPVLLACVSSAHSTIRELSCGVLGALAQNNPMCQEQLLMTGALRILLALLDSADDSVAVRAKALYAVSSMVRGFEPGMESFEALDGYSHLMRAMQADSDNLFIKAAFLITHLIKEYKPAKDILLSMGYTDLLITHLCTGDLVKPAVEQQDAAAVDNSSLCRELCTGALLNLCAVSTEARDACVASDGLLEALQLRLESVRGREEYQEEKDYITELLQLLNQPSGPPDNSDENLIR